MEPPFVDNLGELKSRRGIVDQRTRPYLDSFLAVTSFIKQYRGKT